MCVRERAREGESEEGENVCMCVCVKERESERERETGRETGEGGETATGLDIAVVPGDRLALVEARLRHEERLARLMVFVRERESARERGGVKNTNRP